MASTSRGLADPAWAVPPSALPILYLVFFFVWAILLGLWLRNIWTNRGTPATHFQLQLGSIPSTKVLVMLVGTIYWWRCAIAHDCLRNLSVFAMLLRVVYETVLVRALLLITYGYSFVRAELTKWEHRLVLGLSLALLASLIIYHLYVPYSYLLLMFVYVAAAAAMLLNIVRTLRIVKGNLALVQRDEGGSGAPSDTRTLLYAQYAMFRNLQAFIIAQYVCDLLLHTAVGLSVRQYWIRLLLHEFMEFVTFVFVGWNFRGRRGLNPSYVDPSLIVHRGVITGRQQNGGLYRAPPSEMFNFENPGELSWPGMDAATGDMGGAPENGPRDGAPWAGASRGLPLLPSSQRSQKPMPLLVVVQNPGTSDNMLGHVQMAVATPVVPPSSSTTVGVGVTRAPPSRPAVVADGAPRPQGHLEKVPLRVGMGDSSQAPTSRPRPASAFPHHENGDMGAWPDAHREADRPAAHTDNAGAATQSVRVSRESWDGDGGEEGAEALGVGSASRAASATSSKSSKSGATRRWRDVGGKLGGLLSGGAPAPPGKGKEPGGSSWSAAAPSAVAQGPVVVSSRPSSRVRLQSGYASLQDADVGGDGTDTFLPEDDARESGEAGGVSGSLDRDAGGGGRAEAPLDRAAAAGSAGHRRGKRTAMAVVVDADLAPPQAPGQGGLDAASDETHADASKQLDVGGMHPAVLPTTVRRGGEPHRRTSHKVHQDAAHPPLAPPAAGRLGDRDVMSPEMRRGTSRHAPPGDVRAEEESGGALGSPLPGGSSPKALTAAGVDFGESPVRKHAGEGVGAVSGSYPNGLFARTSVSEIYSLPCRSPPPMSPGGSSARGSGVDAAAAAAAPAMMNPVGGNSIPTVAEVARSISFTHDKGGAKYGAFDRARSGREPQSTEGVDSGAAAMAPSRRLSFPPHERQEAHDGEAGGGKTDAAGALRKSAEGDSRQQARSKPSAPVVDKPLEAGKGRAGLPWGSLSDIRPKAEGKQPLLQASSRTEEASQLGGLSPLAHEPTQPAFGEAHGLHGDEMGGSALAGPLGARMRARADDPLTASYHSEGSLSDIAASVATGQEDNSHLSPGDGPPGPHKSGTSGKLPYHPY